MAGGSALMFRFEELKRSLDIQRDTADVLHVRSNTLLVALLGVAAFVGPEAIDASTTPPCAVGMLGAGSLTRDDYETR